MTYSSLLQTLANQLLQPSSIAALTSVGIHALLGVASPNLPVFQQGEQPTWRSVELIQLNSAELTRLPDFAQSKQNVPPFPNTPLSNLNIPRSSSQLLPLPKSSSSTTNSQLFLSPSSRNKSFRNNGVVTSTFPNLPTPQVINRQFVNNSSNSITQPNNLPPPPPSEQFSYSTGIIPNGVLPYIPPSQDFESGSESESKPQDTPPSSSPPNPPISEAQRFQALVADIRNRQRRIQENKANTTDEEALRNYVHWLEQVKQKIIEQENPQELTITGIYPRDACLKKISGTSIYGILVNNEGTVTNFYLIKSSGYPIFNERAVEDIRNRNFDNQTNQPKAYRINVNFQYESKVCPALTLSPLESTTTPKPENETPNTPVEASKPENETPNTPVEASKPENETLNTPVEASKPENETLNTPVEISQPENKAPNTPVEALAPNNNRVVPLEAPKPENETPTTPVESSTPSNKPIQIEVPKPANENLITPVKEPVTNNVTVPIAVPKLEPSVQVPAEPVDVPENSTDE